MTLPSATWAQGTIDGIVRSGDSGDGLGGARVEIPALDIIAFTWPDGSLTLPGVAAGTHTIEVRLIGFGLLTEDVAVTSGQTTEIELMLDIVTFTLDELVVVGSRTRPRTVTESEDVSWSLRRRSASRPERCTNRVPSD